MGEETENLNRLIINSETKSVIKKKKKKKKPPNKQKSWARSLHRWILPNI